MQYSNKERNLLSWARTLPFYCEWHITEEAATFQEDLFQEACMKFADYYTDGLKEIDQEEHLRTLYECIQKEMECNLPERIKSNIADIRVLALGYLTKEIYDELMEYSKSAELLLEQIEKDVHAAYQEGLSHLSNQAKEVMNRSFHDSRILDCGYEGKDLYFLLKMDVGFAPLKDQYLKLRIKNAEILEGTISKSLECWLQEELYYKEKAVMLNIHFSGGDVLIRAEDIGGDYCYSFLACDKELPLLKQEDIVAGKVKDLIQEEKLTIEDARMHPLFECMGEEAFMNMSILISGDFDELDRLNIKEMADPEAYRAYTDKTNLYEINLVNRPHINIEEGISTWPRGKELLEYIRDNCNQELELWIVWTDCGGELEHWEFSLSDLSEDYLCSIYKDTPDGIVLSKKLTIRA
jgi:hypothetical protein